MLEKRWLLTGGTGTLGQALVKRLLHENDVGEIRVFSRDEYKQSEMARKIKDKRVTYWLGDIRNRERMKEATEGIDIVIHTAAMKRMDTISQNTAYVADVNINGTRNVVLAGKDCEKVIFVSTDKAHAPSCIYGATKMVAEGIVLAKKNGIVWRFGNFIGSRGSVWKIFEEQKKTGQLTITDPSATRFVMTIDEACECVLTDISPGKYYPNNLKAIKIGELAREIAPTANWNIIGLREGEKLHEAFSENYSSDLCLNEKT